MLDQQIIPLCCGMHMWHTSLCSVGVSVYGAGFKGMYSAVYGAVCTVHAMGARCGDYGGEEPSLGDTHWPLSCCHGVQCRTALHTGLHSALNNALDIEFPTLLLTDPV